MTKFRFRWDKQGDHVHINVFLGIPGFTFANCGHLTMSLDEFKQFNAMLRAGCPTMEFIEEGK